MIPTNRNRTLWALVALAALYGLGAVIVYYTVGFGPLAFVVSIIVYGIILVTALVLAATESSTVPQQQASEPKATSTPTPMSTMDSRTDTRMHVVYDDGQNRIIRADSGSLDREADFLVVDGQKVSTLAEIEEELDTMPVSMVTRPRSVAP